MSKVIPKNLEHVKRVCSLYKKALRNLEAYYDERYVFRYRAVLLRQRFELNRNEPDARKVQQMVADGEKELFECQHYQPRAWPNSPGGVAYERDVEPPDWVLDYWHPLEKARYPEYFARREQRKKEWVEIWEKQYGKPKPGEYESHH